MTDKNPYDSLVIFINYHHIKPTEEMRLREIIKKINEVENISTVLNPIDENGNPNKKVTYCRSCGTNVKNQTYCHGCGRKLNWDNMK